jgi:hypothetical protein
MSEAVSLSGPDAVSEFNAVSAAAGAVEQAFRVANEEW